MTEFTAPWGESFFGEYTSVAEKWGDGHLSVGDITAPVGAGLDLLGAFVDPVKWIVGNLLDPIYNWIIANVPPVKKSIELVSGSPEEVRAQGDMYKQVSQGIIDQTNALVAAINPALQSWEGMARDAFRTATELVIRTQQGLSKAFEAIANLTYAFGVVVAATKELVIAVLKELMNELVSKGIMAALAAVPSLGTAVAAYMSWAAAKVALVFAKVSRIFAKLLSKCSKLAGKGSKLSSKLGELSNKLASMSANASKRANQASQHAKSWDKSNATGAEHFSKARDYQRAANRDHATAQDFNLRHADPGVADNIRNRADEYADKATTEYKAANDHYQKVLDEHAEAGYGSPGPDGTEQAISAVDEAEKEHQEALQDGRFGNVDQTVDPLVD
ncbi:WXG100 family type VII secretion target [uncultured Tessaracoccus sp.]|uniref:WXG100 family type VII secretion target n=1 Tax=uncultured Tessaracoccus sp. TaxID=905023 RepID=UPI00260C2260|nr:WXG100 family type VII secretion target [uncultured Tessaracoccus sp.]